jgi:hypothetical protein
MAQVDAFHGSLCFASCEDAPDLAACLASPSDPEMVPGVVNDPLSDDRHVEIIRNLRRDRRSYRKSHNLPATESDESETIDE